MEENNGDYIIREAKVVSTDDYYGGKRIKVRLRGIDTGKEDSDLPYCFPLIPKLIHVHPKTGEAVLIILQKTNAGYSNRYYIGPILSQAYFFNKDLAEANAYSLLNDKKVSPLPIPSSDPENNGTLPDEDDIAIIGRTNTDLILKDEEVRLRCGFKKEPYGSKKVNLHFNKIDPAYIQMKYKKLTLPNGRDVNSVINIVADRINLLSRDSKNPYNVTDPDSLITDEEQLKILQTAHPLVYGDELINFLKKFVEIFRTHEHPFHQDEPDFSQPEVDVLNTDLDKMLSNAIRIN